MCVSPHHHYPANVLRGDVTPRLWLCSCGTRNERIKQKCTNPDCFRKRPKRPVRAHQKALRDFPYSAYVQTALEVHGVSDESCCACSKPRSQERHHDRDHCHLTGRRRGLLCGGNRGCNVLLVPWVTAPVARGIADAKLEADEPDAHRWHVLADYLHRVEVFYAGVPS